MEEKIRKQFVIVSMSAVTIVMSLVVVVMNIANYRQIITSSNEIISVLSDNDGKFPDIISKTFQRLNIEPVYSTQFFTAKIDNDFNISDININSSKSITNEKARSLTRYAIENKKDTAIIDYFRYTIVDKPYGRLIIFVDFYQESQLSLLFLHTSLIMCISVLMAIFFLLLIFSQKAVAPIIESNQRQKQFITDISHELKTPLAIIKVNTEVIEMETSKTQWSESIHNQITQLNNLIQYLISLTKLDEGDNEIIKSDFILSDITSTVIPSFQTLASAKNMRLIPNVEPVSVYNDQQSINLLLSILIENAIKYGDPDSDILITLTKNKNKCSIQISNNVKDLAVGDYKKWLQRFYREDMSRNRNSNSFGIGLAMAESIANKHNSTIQIKCTTPEFVTFKTEI